MLVEKKITIDWEKHHIRYKLENTDIIDADILPKEWLTEDVLREFKDKVDWKSVVRHISLSEDFLRENWDYLEQKLRKNIDDITYYHLVNEHFIEEFRDKLYWLYVSSQQNLSPQFIERWNDFLDWEFISRYQNLTDDLVLKFANKVNWTKIFRYQKHISSWVLDKFRNEVDLNTYRYGMRAWKGD